MSCSDKTRGVISGRQEPIKGAENCSNLARFQVKAKPLLFITNGLIGAGRTTSARMFGRRLELIIMALNVKDKQVAGHSYPFAATSVCHDPHDLIDEEVSSYLQGRQAKNRRWICFHSNRVSFHDLERLQIGIGVRLAEEMKKRSTGKYRGNGGQACL